jgi:hypothetical protein
MAKKIRVWDGSAWQDVAPSLPYTAIHSAQASMPATGVDGQVWLDTDGTLADTGFVPLTGGTMTGNLNVPSINSGPIVGRNKILNGDFSIWQRGTSFSSSGQYTADRWVCILNGTASRQQFTTGSAPISGYEGQYYLNWTINANAQNAEMLQRIEDVRTFAGQTVTLSFWARSTAGAQPLNVAIYQNFGTGGSPSSMVPATLISGTSPYTPTSTWQRFSFTFSIPSISGKTLGTNNDHFLWVRTLQFTTTATNTSIDIWGVQLEAGNQATPFHTATPNQQTELAACQRYYRRFDASSNAYSILMNSGIGYNATTAVFPFFIGNSMRTVPSSIDYSSNLRLNDSVSTINVSSMNIDGAATKDIAMVIVTVGGSGTAYRPYYLQANNSTSSYIGFSAEL